MGTTHDSLEEPDNSVGGMEDDSDSSSLTSDSDDDMDSDFGSGEEDDKDAKEVAKEEDKDELDDEDPVVKAIEKAKEKKSANHPPDIVLDSIPSTISFHPKADHVAFGNYEGQILLYSYSVDGNTKLVECQHKGHSVRAITFIEDGQKLISTFSDQTLKIFDVEHGLTVTRTIRNATPAPTSSVYGIDDNVFATGDDDGNVLLWDSRANYAATATIRMGEDAITSMVSNLDRRILVCTSEEGAIYALKIRGGRVEVESEVYDYEFNCSCVFKQESKLAVGDGKGDVYIFNWNEFGRHSDVYTRIGRGEAIQAMIPITEKIILCGGDDGFIRAYNFFPHKFLGIVGKVGHPVEKMDVCNNGHLVSSIGPDEVVKFWNVSYFEDMTVSGSSKEAKKEATKGPKNNHKRSGQNADLARHNLPSSSHQNAADFFKGLADD